ncbi:hypothetical protein ABRP91_03155 [Pectobacterium brasiliense]|uniref:hypothetical protein n=1 Tax=Pectobacterium brasiliense TaxID=180957 RepID=UPI0032EC25A3
MEYNHERTYSSLNNMTPAELIQTLQKGKDIELAREKISHQISQLSKNTEMLYFIVAKKIDPFIFVTKLNDHTNADELINALADIFYDW